TMKLDGSDSRVLASGLRNPVGLALHPRTGELYAAVNERDRLGNDLVPDYITRVQENAFYGWPYAYLSPNHLDPRHVKDGRSVAPDLAARTITPDVLIESHSAALGLTFYSGTAFPERYRKGAFSALRGSWNRDQGTGYKIIFVPFAANERPEGGYEDFVTGFLSDPQQPGAWGRPVGIMEMPDGSLLFTDDANHRVYRISYDAARASKS
ncbi:MAG: PQQ-dependent sugar dehydrogenase, partial [Rariglobus sp.]